MNPSIKRIAALCTILALLLCGAGLSENAPRSVTDMTGREIRLEGPVTRAVALTAADCEILYALGAGDALVGRGEYCDYPEAALDVPMVQSGAGTNLEQIIALSPQVVFMNTMAQSAEQIEQLEAAGIRVVVSEATDIAGVFDAIRVIGEVMDRNDAAAALIEDMTQGFDELASQAGSHENKPRIYFEVSPLIYGLWTAGSGTFMNEIATLLGAENVFADVDGWAGISEEQVIERNPDCIVTIAMYDGQGETPEQEIIARPGWAQVAAVREKRILSLRDESLSRPGPRLLDGARKLCEFLYAE